MSVDFVHLHLHSHYSVLDGVSKIPEIVEKTKEYGQNAVALTDHGNMFGTMEFFHSATKNDVKPIFGSELYLAPESRFSKDKTKKNYYHLVLLAENLTGYKNLMKLCSIGYVEGMYRKPRIDKEVLREHSEGLIALSACLGGELPFMIMEGNENQLARSVEWYVDTFGKERFFLELQNHKIPQERTVADRLIKLSNETGLGLVATNDAHYITREDSIIQEIMFAIRSKTTLDDPNRFKYETDEFYIKSPDEMAKLFSGVPESIANTVKISEMCNVDLAAHIKGQDHTPKFTLPKGKTADIKLRELCNDGIAGRFDGGDIPENYNERLDKELKLISTMGFSNYFLVVHDFVNYARKKGILVGPGRGSAAGALVAYSLRITNIDPMKYDLLFERFLNPERVSMPDIDIDFQDDRRDEVKEYIRSFYGYNRTSDVITFGISKSRNALKDVGRVLEIPLSKVNQTTKLIPDKLANDKKMNLTKLMDKIPELKKLKENGSAQEKKWIEYSSRIDGSIRNLGSHASALIISDVPLNEVVPLYRDSRSETVSTQFDGGYLEENGLLKMDILGLSNLTMIQDSLRRIRKNHHVDIDIDNLDNKDKKVYHLIQQGDTSGVFQLESPGMKEMLVKMKPNTFEDIIACLALYRPGPLNSGMVDDYIERKAGRQAIEYPHDSLESVLKNTYGIIVYQEQVMKIAQVIANFTLGGADQLRRAVAKKKADEMQRLRGVFVDGAKKNKVSADCANGIFDLIDKFAEYGFNKSHSAAYALVTFITAFLKSHYRVEFMSALLTLNMGDSEKIKQYCQECQAAGLKIMPPDINQSVWEYKEGENVIYFGFGGIKGLGEAVTDIIIEEREMGGPFQSFEEFAERMLKYSDFKKSSVEILAKAGAFDSLIDKNNFFLEKGILIRNIDSYINQVDKNKKEQETGNLGLFGDMDNGGFEVHINRNVQPYSSQEEFENELKVFGFYLSGNLFKEYTEKFGDISRFSFGLLNKLKVGTAVFVFGYFDEVIIKETGRNRRYGIVNFDNGYDSNRFYIFDRFDEFEPRLKVNTFVGLKVMVTEGKRGKQYDLMEIIPIESVAREAFTQFHIVVDNSDTTNGFAGHMAKLKSLTEAPENSGKTKLFFHMMDLDGPVQVAASDRYSIRYSHEWFDIIKALPEMRAYWLF